MHIPQIRRYESGPSQLTLDVIGKFSVSADMLLFEELGRSPDDDLRLQFEAISRFDEEKRVMRSMLESIILKHKVRRWEPVSNGGERK